MAVEGKNIPINPFYYRGLTQIKTWIINHIRCFMWDVITHPCINSNGSFVELPFKLMHGCVIPLTPYMVFPLFATRFAAYAGGILVSFIQPHLFSFDIKCPAWEIYHTDLYGWNPYACFPCMRNLGRTGILIDELLRFSHRTLLFWCVEITNAPKL